MAFVVLHDPVTGYANNLDFFRQSACVGLWENYTDRPRIAADLDGPVGDLVYDGTRIHESCVHSSDNLFAWAVAHLHRKHDHVPLQQVGAARMLTAWAVMLLVLVQPVTVWFRLMCALALALVFGDIAVLTYFNTLYVDASGLMFCTAVVALIGVMFARLRAPGWGFCAWFSLCLLWLGATKPQYAPLAAGLGLVASCCMLGVWRNWARAGGLAVAAVLAGLVFSVMNPAGKPVMMAMRGANNADSFLGALLPQAADTGAALADVGLPESCAAAMAVGGNGEPVQAAKLCPEIARVSRLSLPLLFLRQPRTLWRPLEIGIWGSRPSYLWFPRFEGKGDEAGWGFRLMRATSLSVRLAWLPFGLYRGLVVTLCAVGVGLGPVWLAGGVAGRPAWVRRYPAAGFLVMGGGVCFYALVSSVFGDGFSELARHTACLLVGVAFFGVGLVGCLRRFCGAARCVGSHRGRRRAAQAAALRLRRPRCDDPLHDGGQRRPAAAADPRPAGHGAVHALRAAIQRAAEGGAGHHRA
jgi:hypothetical protein